MGESQPEIQQIYLIIGVAVVAMLLMAGSIILFVLFYQKRMVQEQFKRQQMELDYQKKMMEAALESQENERRRVAGDLHDSIGAMLSTIRVSLITHAKKHKDDESSIQESKKMLDDTIESVRRISRDLMPSTLEKFGLIQAVKEMCERFQGTTGIPIVFEESGDTPPLSKSRELMIFRIVQELLNNALKHAEATFIKVMFANGDLLQVIVEDNGKGFNPEEHKSDRTPGKGLGLFNMENRARLVGATIEFNAPVVQGSKIILNVPYEKI
jgi:two-component system, NarL family, sensor kinase